MNKTEFAKELAGRTELTLAQAANVTEHFLDLLKEGVHKGERIAFLGFGTFSTARRAARTGVNPRNPTQKVKIPARTVVRFAAGSRFKEAANGKFKPLGTPVAPTAKKDVKKVAASSGKVVKKATASVTKDVKKIAAVAKKDVKKAAPKKGK
ncbi:MAG: HU family DNA-binding protein [Thermoleophilia bacterium]|nr:HU family DNA-binding protein [Thermoleophilia bacterium]